MSIDVDKTRKRVLEFRARIPGGKKPRRKEEKNANWRARKRYCLFGSISFEGDVCNFHLTREGIQPCTPSVQDPCDLLQHLP